MMGSGLDCIECGGFVSLERVASDGLCQGCRTQQQREHAAYVAAGKELQTFRCRHCGAATVYDPPEFYLVRFWQAMQAFEDAHRPCATREAAP